MEVKSHCILDCVLLFASITYWKKYRDELYLVLFVNVLFWGIPLSNFSEIQYGTNSTLTSLDMLCTVH